MLKREWVCKKRRRGFTKIIDFYAFFSFTIFLLGADALAVQRQEAVDHGEAFPQGKVASGKFPWLRQKRINS